MASIEYDRRADHSRRPRLAYYASVSCFLRRGRNHEDRYDALIMAVPAYSAASLLRSTCEDIASELEAIPYADSAVVVAQFDRRAIDPKWLCFGIVIPQREGRDTLAISFTSEKYPGRVPKDKILLRLFLGGRFGPT